MGYEGFRARPVALLLVLECLREVHLLLWRRLRTHSLPTRSWEPVLVLLPNAFGHWEGAGRPGWLAGWCLDWGALRETSVLQASAGPGWPRPSQKAAAGGSNEEKEVVR